MQASKCDLLSIHISCLGLNLCLVESSEAAHAREESMLRSVVQCSSRYFFYFLFRRSRHNFTHDKNV